MLNSVRRKRHRSFRLLIKRLKRLWHIFISKTTGLRSNLKKTGSYTQGLKVEAANEFDFNILLGGLDDIQWDTGPVPPRYYRFNRDIKLQSGTGVLSPGVISEWWRAWAITMALQTNTTGMSIWYEIFKFKPRKH